MTSDKCTTKYPEGGTDLNCLPPIPKWESYYKPNISSLEHLKIKNCKDAINEATNIGMTYFDAKWTNECVLQEESIDKKNVQILNQNHLIIKIL